MGKSLRTSLMSYTSVHLRRPRTGPGPIASSSSSHPGQGEIGEPSRSLLAAPPSRSLRVASRILSNTTRHHPTSSAEATAVVRRSTSHTTSRTAASGFLNERFSSKSFLPPIPGGPRRLLTLRGTSLLKPPASPGAGSLTNSALLYALIPEVTLRLV